MDSSVITAVQLYEVPLCLVGFLGAWAVAMLTGLMFRSAL